MKYPLLHLNGNVYTNHHLAHTTVLTYLIHCTHILSTMLTAHNIRTQARASQQLSREIIPSRLGCSKEIRQLGSRLVCLVSRWWHSKCATKCVLGLYNILDWYGKYVCTCMFVRKIDNRSKLKELGSKFGPWISLLFTHQYFEIQLRDKVKD